MIVALVVALVGPFFIDWNAYRSTFETYAERALGHSVTVLGKADARLLPTPTLVFSDVRVGEAEDPLMVISRFETRIDLIPLLNGEIRVVDMRLEEPELHLALDESGRVDWLTAVTPYDSGQIDPAAVQLNSVDVQGGSVEVIDARTGTTYRAGNLNLNISARSLNGPYKVEGAGTVAGKQYSLRLASGRPDKDGATRIKAELVPAEYPATLKVDALLSEAEGAPRFAGDFVLASVFEAEPVPNGAALPPGAPVDVEPAVAFGTAQTARLWQAEGAFELDPARLSVDSFSFRHGREDRPLRLEGDGRITFGADPRFKTDITAKQVDLDRIFGAGPQEPVDIDRATTSTIEALKAFPLPPIPGSLTIDLPGLVAGGGIIQNIIINAETLPRGWRVAALKAQLPGRSDLAASGELRLSGTPGFEGQVRLSSEQPSALAGWWRKGAAARPLSLDGFEVDARIDVTPDALVLSGLEGRSGDSAFTGSVTWRNRPDGGRAVVTADIDADSLDIDQLRELAGLASRRNEVEAAVNREPAGVLASTDVSLRLAADRLRLGGTEAEEVEVEASYADDTLVVERLHAKDFAGARINAKGRVSSLTSAPDGGFTTTVSASDLAGLTTVATDLFPGHPITDFLTRASPSLSPADLTAEFTARAGGGGGTQAELKLDGQLAGSNLKGTLGFTGRVDHWRDAELDLQATVLATDGVELLRQLGFEVLPIEDTGSARAELTARGEIGAGLDVQFFASGLGSEFEAQGNAGFPERGARLFGFDTVLRADDIGPFGLLSGRVLPVLAGELPLKASARVDVEGQKVDIRDIDATVDDIRVTGRLRGDFSAPRPVLGGELNTTTVSAGFLSELVLGADAWSSVSALGTAAAGQANGRWPSGAFSPPFLRDLIINAQVSAARADVGLSQPVEQASFSLQASGGELAVDNFKGAFEGGEMSGSLLIKRSAGEAALSGNVRLSDADLEALVWRRAGRPVARGRLDVSLDFEGTGRSVSGIVAGLAGGGTFSIRDGELRGINTAAFNSIIRAADAGLELENDAIRKAFLSHLDAGSLPFQSLDGSLTIAAGTARARNVTIDTDAASAFGTATVDLENWTVDSDWSLKVDPGENAVTGAEPQVGVVFRGPLESPARSIDIAPLTAYLTLRAFEQEVRRVEKLQEDILERDRFLRELRRQKEDAERAKREEEARSRSEEEARAEEAAKAAEAARRKEEADARAKAEAEAAAEKRRKLLEQERAARERAEADRIAREAAAKAAEAANRNAAPSEGALSPEDFARRIRPAIEGGDGLSTGSSSLRPLEPAGEINVRGEPGRLPLPLAGDGNSSLDGLIETLNEPAAPANDNFLPGVDTAPSAPPTTQSIPTQRRRSRAEPEPQIPRYIMAPNNRVVPNPAYPGN